MTEKAKYARKMVIKTLSPIAVSVYYCRGWCIGTIDGLYSSYHSNHRTRGEAWIDCWKCLQERIERKLSQ